MCLRYFSFDSKFVYKVPDGLVDNRFCCESDSRVLLDNYFSNVSFGGLLEDSFISLNPRCSELVSLGSCISYLVSLGIDAYCKQFNKG
jgi:hypothetical protein